MNLFIISNNGQTWTLGERRNTEKYKIYKSGLHLPHVIIINQKNKTFYPAVADYKNIHVYLIRTNITKRTENNKIDKNSKGDYFKE